MDKTGSIDKMDAIAVNDKQTLEVLERDLT